MKAKKEETSISNFFDKEGKKVETLTENYDLGDTLRYHLDSVRDEDIHSAIDVGSGSGILLVELLKHGVATVTGVELSEEYNDLARQRLQQQGLDSQAALITGSFLDLSSDQPADAISFHNVLCCHPDYQGMLTKSAELQSKIITITIPRDHFLIKLGFAITGFFMGLFIGFRPYIHSQKKIDQELTQLGYSLVNRQKFGFQVASTYRKTQSKSSDTPQ